MKKLLIAATVLAVAAVVMMGCDLLFGKTYVYSFGTYFCMEVTTNNLDLQAELENSGFSEGTCSTATAVGSCSITEIAEDLSSYTLEMYYYDAYYTATEAQASCEASEGVWSAL